MARVRMVTRTVEVTVVKVMCVQVSTATVTNEEFRLTGKFADENAILKHLSKMVDEDLKPVAITYNATEDVLYGMLEEEFIKLAQVLPPRTANEEE